MQRDSAAHVHPRGSPATSSSGRWAVQATTSTAPQDCSTARPGSMSGSDHPQHKQCHIILTFTPRSALVQKSRVTCQATRPLTPGDPGCRHAPTARLNPGSPDKNYNAFEHAFGQ